MNAFHQKFRSTTFILIAFVLCLTLFSVVNVINAPRWIPRADIFSIIFDIVFLIAALWLDVYLIILLSQRLRAGIQERTIMLNEDHHEHLSLISGTLYISDDPQFKKGLKLLVDLNKEIKFNTEEEIPVIELIFGGEVIDCEVYAK